MEIYSFQHSAAVGFIKILVLLGWSWQTKIIFRTPYLSLWDLGYNAYEYSSPTGIPQLSGIIMTIQMGIVWLLASFTKDGTEDYHSLEVSFG